MTRIKYAIDSKLEFAQHVYDVDFYQKNYREIDGKIFRVNNAGNSLIPTLAYFEENFEDTDSPQNFLMQNESDEAGWTGFTLQSPRAHGVSDYIKLNQCISKNGCDFLENRVEPSDTVVRSGTRSLRTYSVPPSFGVPVAKASLDTELLHYKKGDTVWFSAWYYIEKGMPTSIMDIESSWMTGYPGMRIFVDESGLPSLELKAFSTPHFKQRGETVLLPIGKWFHIKTHFYLSEKEDGLAELWLDGQKIISEIGQTLPLADTVYNNLEVWHQREFIRYEYHTLR